LGSGQFGPTRCVASGGRPRQTLDLVAVFDLDCARAANRQPSSLRSPDYHDLADGFAPPSSPPGHTRTLRRIVCALMRPVSTSLIEKPIAAEPTSPRGLSTRRDPCGRILQVGHLERYNPAVGFALEQVRSTHCFLDSRPICFSRSSLDVDSCSI